MGQGQRLLNEGFSSLHSGGEYRLGLAAGEGWFYLFTKILLFIDESLKLSYLEDPSLSTSGTEM